MGPSVHGTLCLKPRERAHLCPVEWERTHRRVLRLRLDYLRGLRFQERENGEEQWLHRELGQGQCSQGSCDLPGQCSPLSCLSLLIYKNAHTGLPDMNQFHIHCISLIKCYNVKCQSSSEVNQKLLILQVLGSFSSHIIPSQDLQLNSSLQRRVPGLISSCWVLACLVPETQ